MNCPKCDQKLPYFRKPTSLGQLLLGGWNCPNCQTAVDGNGRELAGPYKTGAAALLLVLLYGGIALGNYLFFFAGRHGLALLTLVLTLGLVFLGLGVIKPHVRAHAK